MFMMFQSLFLNSRQTLKVSDHYPIELELKAKGKRPRSCRGRFQNNAFDCTSNGQTAGLDVFSTSCVLGLTFAVHILLKAEL